MTALELFE